MARLTVLTEKQRLLISVGVVAVGTVGLGLWWGLGFRASQALEKEVGTLRKSLATAQAAFEKLDDLRREMRDAAEEKRRLAQLLPDQPDLERFMEILKAVEGQAGRLPSGEIDFTLTGGKFIEERLRAGARKTAVNPAYDEWTVELTASGSWTGFISFIDGLEHADRLVAIKSFKTKEPSKKVPHYYEFQLALGVYVLKPPPPAGGPASAARPGVRS